MNDIVLTTINAKYIHASLGLRYLYANLGDLQSKAVIREFTLESRPIDIAESILLHSPQIIGLGVYIWNIEQSIELVQIIKAVAPQVSIVVGGPEVSYEIDKQSWLKDVDYIIPGPADISFALLCQALFDKKPPINKIISSPAVKLEALKLPYEYFSDEDIANRVIYVEASRGCPFKCEFCLSSLDKTATPFELERFLDAMDTLFKRGTRHFKFVDRTFNLKTKTGVAILEFFLARLDDQLFLHFEIIPDHLPDGLKALISQFPSGCLQFEIGIQSFNPVVQELISRKQNTEKTLSNITWLRQNSNAHLHTDLIVGLPGEDMESVANGFDQLVALNPHEIQVGILKRLKGTPLDRHTQPFEMVYNPKPPFNILRNSLLDFDQIQRMNRFARYWDMIGNSGRFTHTRDVILGDSPFKRFYLLSDWLFQQTDKTHRIALKRLFEYVFLGLTGPLGVDIEIAKNSLWQDYQLSGLKGWPQFIDSETGSKTKHASGNRSGMARQARHLA